MGENIYPGENYISGDLNKMMTVLDCLDNEVTEIIEKERKNCEDAMRSLSNVQGLNKVAGINPSRFDYIYAAINIKINTIQKTVFSNMKLLSEYNNSNKKTTTPPIVKRIPNINKNENIKHLFFKKGINQVGINLGEIIGGSIIVFVNGFKSMLAGRKNISPSYTGATNIKTESNDNNSKDTNNYNKFSNATTQTNPGTTTPQPEPTPPTKPTNPQPEPTTPTEPVNPQPEPTTPTEPANPQPEPTPTPPVKNDNGGSNSGIDHGGNWSNGGNYNNGSENIWSGTTDNGEVTEPELPDGELPIDEPTDTELPGNEEESIYTIPTNLSSAPTNKKTNSGSSVIPILGGLGAAAAVGVGAKIYMDNKKNNDNGEDDDYTDDFEFKDENNDNNNDLLADEWKEDNNDDASLNFNNIVNDASEDNNDLGEI